MVNRVVLDVDGLRVSKPGINVLTATNNQFAFHSDWSQLELNARQTLTLPATPSSSMVNEGNAFIPKWVYRTAQQSFGKTFTTMPVVNVCVRAPSASNAIAGTQVGFFGSRRHVAMSTNNHYLEWLLVFHTATHWWAEVVANAGPSQVDFDLWGSHVITVTSWDFDI